MDAHLSRQVVANLLMRSTRRSDEPSRLFLLFDLAPDGGCLAAFVTKAPVVSYTTFSPLLLRAVCLCGPIHDLTTIQGLPGILLCGVRTFLTIKRAHLADLSELRISEGEGNVKHWRIRIGVGARHAMPAFKFGDLAVKSLSWSHREASHSGDHERTRHVKVVSRCQVEP